MEIFLLLIAAISLFYLYDYSFYKGLFNRFSDGVSIISDNKTVDCNDTLVKLFGYKDKKEFLSVHPLNLTPAFQPDGSLSFEKANKMMEVAKKEGKCKFDWVFLDSEQNEKWIEIDILKIDRGFFFKEKFCMVWRDITLRVNVQKQLEEFNNNLEDMIKKEVQKNKEKEDLLIMQSKLAQLGEMLSMIAHQWRQPLSAISSSVIDMQMKLVLNKDDKELLPYIEKQLDDIENFTQSLTNTIDDFKDFYKPGKKKKHLNINSTIDRAFSMVKNSLVSYNIKVDFDLASSRKIYIFENEIMQVFLNILQNSRENFTLKDTRNPNITISTMDEGENKVIIKICDNGGGCDESIINRIFEPYFSTKYEKNGTGLGLYMSLKIVQEHHNGNIEAVNENGGLCFIITLEDD